ncbi:MAG: sulfatase-like hydrolase/transferase [Opitutaceae bacterium]
MPRQAILFLIDTQGANCVGCYAGNPALGTPHLDRLASEGMRFERAYTCSPVCGPARSAIFTSLYPHSNGVLGNDQAPHLDIPTTGQRLHKAGIPAAYIGKWHLDGTDYFGDGRCPPGWDPAYWFDGRTYLDSLPNQAMRDLSRRVLSPQELAAHGITAEFTHAHRTADRAIQFIQAHREEDFFLVVSIDEPHHPFISPEPFASAFEDFRFPIGPAATDSLAGKPRSQQEWAQHVARTAAETSARMATNSITTILATSLATATATTRSGACSRK